MIKESNTMKIRILRETTDQERLLIHNTVKKIYRDGFNNAMLWRMNYESYLRKVY